MLKEKIKDLQIKLENDFNLESWTLDNDFTPILNTLEYNF